MTDCIDDIVANSYRNFHAKGFDYLCMKRSENLTVKAYFFDGDLVNQPELVMPHNHRYPFTTQVVAGAVEHKLYQRGMYSGEPSFNDMHMPKFTKANEFDYRTPLNGGNGFTYSREVWMREHRSEYHTIGDNYHCESRHIHTLRVCKEGTIIVLIQLADDVPLDKPTQAFSFTDSEPPSLNGLYDSMTVEHALKRIIQLEQLGWK